MLTRGTTAAGALVLAAVACVAPSPASHATTPREAPADSVVLERSRCFGFCPAYRLSITSSGEVHFQSRNPRDSTRTARDTVPREAFSRLIDHASRAGLRELPARIMDDPALCSRLATDMPGAIITLFSRDTTVRVDDYHGCHGSADHPDSVQRLERLRAWEAEVDSVAGSARWIVAPGSR